MVIDTSIIVGAVISIIVGVAGFLLVRSIGAIDDSIKALVVKGDAHGDRSTKIEIEVAGLRARVVALEFIVHRGMPPPEKTQ